MNRVHAPNRHARTLIPVVLTLTLLMILPSLFASTGAQGFTARSTPTPTPSTIDDIAPNPTEVPDEEIDDLAPNPTAVPTDEPVDDLAPNPTEVPPVEDEAIPTTGTVRVIKKDCHPEVGGGLFLSDYLFLCPDLHNGVEFVLNDVDGAQAGVTANGMVEWTGVDPGVFNITETVPAGYADPIVFCGYTESPGGGVQHPVLQDATGGVVQGTFPDTAFEFVCYWMNVQLDDQDLNGADDITSTEPDSQASFELMKYVCPNDIATGEDLAYYLEQCPGTVDGIEFTLSHEAGSETKSTAGGEATWTGIPLGSFTVDEDVPVQFGEPIVFCGWTAFYEGAIYDAFAQPVTTSGGTVELEATIPGAHHFCSFFNVEGVDDFADPGRFANTLVTRKWSCPDGTTADQTTRDVYVEQCELLLDPVDFTLTTADGDETNATVNGFAEWTGVPLGAFTLSEAIPDGYGSPTVFCGWYADYDGFHYDAFPQLVNLTTPNSLDGEITIPNTDYFCDVFNMTGEIDDFQANPTEVPAIDDLQGNPTSGTVRLEKRDCPSDVPTDATLSTYLQQCSQMHDGVEFELENADGVRSGTTAMGQVSWTGVEGGPFELRETLPAGYGDPIVFCGYTESPGGGVQHPSLQPSTGGVLTGTFPAANTFEFVCYWMNVRNAGQDLVGADDLAQPQETSNSLTVRAWTCPNDILPSIDLADMEAQCSLSTTPAALTLTNVEGEQTQLTDPTATTWNDVPLGAFTVQAVTHDDAVDPIVFCWWTAFHDGLIYDDFPHIVPSVGGLVEGEILIPNTTYACSFFLVATESGPGGPDDISAVPTAPPTADAVTVSLDTASPNGSHDRRHPGWNL